MNYNYGLSGQSDEAYDNFLCFTKKCRKRKEERHKSKMARKESKTDQRRAETESMRAETSVMKNIASPNTVSPQLMQSQTPTIIHQPSLKPAQEKPQQAGFAGNSVMIIVGVLLVGGFIYNNMKNKNNAGSVQPGVR